jgi:hypothetical protein
VVAIEVRILPIVEKGAEEVGGGGGEEEEGEKRKVVSDKGAGGVRSEPRPDLRVVRPAQEKPEEDV